jgi:hypothetical protein
MGVLAVRVVLAGRVMVWLWRTGMRWQSGLSVAIWWCAMGSGRSCGSVASTGRRG